MERCYSGYRNENLKFVRVPFSHPYLDFVFFWDYWITKSICAFPWRHFLEQLKYGAFHNDFKAGERCFWYTTTGWMMWNYIHGSLLLGGTMVLYDGSVAYPDLNALWKFVQDVGYIILEPVQGICWQI